MQRILDALAAGILALDIEPVYIPQTAKTTKPRMELLFAGIEGAGQVRGIASAQGWEKITFQALFLSDGTHDAWLINTILASRNLVQFETNPMPITVDTDKRWDLKAHWKRLQPGRFEYPDEEAGSMPVSYNETWQVELSYPAEIVGWFPA